MASGWKRARPLEVTLGVSMLVLALAAPAQAQIGEVVVTAERRETRLQDTPLAVSALDAETLERGGIDTIEDVQFVTPNLTFGSLQNFSLISLRGIGSELTNLQAETSVATFEDGVYLGQTFVQNVPSFDLERIEVLRGPQGTLYGRNSTGGAINFISKAPSFEPEANIDVLAGNYNRFAANLGLTGPIVSDVLAGRISFRYDGHDGRRDNLFNGDEADDLNHVSGRLALLFQPTDNFEFTLRADGTNRESSNPYLAVTNLVAAPTQYTDPNETTDFYNDYPTNVEISVSGISGTAEWDINEQLTLRSITSNRDSELDYLTDNDGTSASILYHIAHQEGEQFTQEFNLFGTAFNGRVDWLLGAFYFDEDASATFNFFIPIAPSDPTPDPALGTSFLDGTIPAIGYLGFDMAQQSESVAGFAHGVFHLTEQTNLTLGVRYTRDEKTAVRSLHSNLVPAAFAGAVLCDGAVATRSWDATTGEVSLDHNITDDMLVYGRVSRGYKAGGFNPGGCNDDFDPETLTAFEIGFKSTAFDRQLRTNVAIFHYDYEDFQFTRYIPNSSVVDNAPGATIDGLEVEFLYAPTALAGFEIDGSVSYLDSEYDPATFADPIFTLPLDIGGNQLVRAPEWKANLGVEYTFAFANESTLTFRGETSYSDSYFHEVFNGEALLQDQTREPSYTISNFRVIWAPNGDRDLLVQAFVENIEDTIYGYARPASLTQGGIAGNFSPPRTYGVRVSARFGGE